MYHYINDNDDNDNRYILIIKYNNPHIRYIHIEYYPVKILNVVCDYLYVAWTIFFIKFAFFT